MSYDWGPQVPPPGAQIAAPIADLSYRNYDGPLRTHAVRWWIVSVATLRAAFRNRIFWVAAFLCLFAYLLHGAGLYIQMQVQHQMGNNPYLANRPPVKFALSFFSALCGELNSIALLIVVLVVGAGTISADNRANALLVYLSKPITKGDYLLGKWVGLFLTFLSVTLFPSLLFYAYCALSYSSDGFFTQDRWLIGRMLLAVMVPPIIHASAIVGFSAWSKSPGIASAFYAGFFLMGGIIVAGLGGTMMAANPDNFTRGNLVQHLSIGGIIDGLVQNIFKVDVPTIWHGRQAAFNPDAPPLFWALLLLGAAVIVLGVGAARMKIQAVEVVRG